MMPSCDQTGVPIHFHSSTTSGSACLMSWRILLRVSPRQSPSSSILFEMSSDGDWPWLAPDFFMFSSFRERLHKWELCRYFSQRSRPTGDCARRLDYSSSSGDGGSNKPIHPLGLTSGILKVP